MATNTAYQQLEVEHFKAREEKGFAIAARRARQLITAQDPQGEAESNKHCWPLHNEKRGCLKSNS